MIHLTHSKHTVFLTKTNQLNLFKDIFYVYLEKSVKVLNSVLVVNLQRVCGVLICVCILNGQVSVMCIRIREKLLKYRDRWRAGVNAVMKFRAS